MQASIGSLRGSMPKAVKCLKALANGTLQALKRLGWMRLPVMHVQAQLLAKHEHGGSKERNLKSHHAALDCHWHDHGVEAKTCPRFIVHSSDNGLHIIWQ